MIKEQETTTQIALLNQEFLTSWELCTSPFPGVELLNGPVIATRWANIDFRFYNALSLTPEAQRKGYADAVIRRALNAAHAATGIRRTSLQATDAGRPVYRRLGYLDICRYICLWPAT